MCHFRHLEVVPDNNVSFSANILNQTMHWRHFRHALQCYVRILCLRHNTPYAWCSVHKKFLWILRQFLSHDFDWIIRHFEKIIDISVKVFMKSSSDNLYDDLEQIIRHFVESMGNVWWLFVNTVGGTCFGSRHFVNKVSAQPFSAGNNQKQQNFILNIYRYNIVTSYERSNQNLPSRWVLARPLRPMQTWIS